MKPLFSFLSRAGAGVTSSTRSRAGMESAGHASPALSLPSIEFEIAHNTAKETPSHHLPAQKPLLPPELVLVIFKKHIRAERLRDKKRTAFLAKCSLVSHAFRELVQPLLFANLDLRPDDFLERKPVVRALQEDGCAAFVVQLHVAAKKEGRRVSRGDLSRLLHECQRLQRLSLNLNLGHPKFLAGCLPMWTNLRRLWIRQSTLDGDLFLTLRHLRELSACTILFSTSVRQGPPPPFHLGSVDLVYPESRLDYDFLLSSSYLTLAALSFGCIARDEAPDLRPFEELESLELLLATEDFNTIGTDVDCIKAVLSSASETLTYLSVGTWDCFDLDGPEYAERDFLRAIPDGVQSVDLANSASLPEIPLDYIDRSMRDLTVLPNLVSLDIPVYYEDEELAADRQDVVDWTVRHRNAVLRFVYQGFDVEEEEE